MNSLLLFLIVTVFTLSIEMMAQQIPITRVEMMPNMPSPYNMQDWKKVALGYDSLVFDLNRQGQYLPLSWLDFNTINYPNHESFGIDSYVGTFAPNSGEAINVLAAVVGATLLGIDKSDQNGHNWVLGCEEFFNNRPQENVYLNNPVTSSGSDWWYDTMPNIFFYQLYDSYPNTGDFNYQFTKIADQWLRAVEKMEGRTTPWHIPFMNYRGWYLESMTPNNTGVPEPEAAGAIAWLLYNAYYVTGQTKYRIGAELALEFLNNWNTNPSYELQLPYGAYTAARMNAEIGTSYSIQKIVNWCFDVGSLRQWGVIVGNWGGYDISGLVGEASGQGDYAFLMNGFEQAGAVLPLVRYDDRFARAIGKWVLNLANASRLMYSKFLPDENQDSEVWSQQYDPNSYIGYEAMRREWNGQSPYATGDAINGGWSATNLGLYGSSHVGILGAIIDTTDVEMILQLDVLKTDYFKDPAYPTYLYYNPYSVDKIVQLNLGAGSHDIYDAVSNSFILTGVSGQTSLSVPADNSMLAVIAPAGGTITYDLDKMLVDGIIVDYLSGQPVTNYPPRIKSLSPEKTNAFIGETIAIFCTAVDKDNDPINYSWNSSGGTIIGSSAQINWTAPMTAGNYDISCTVNDGNGGLDSTVIEIVVTDNRAPSITSISADPEIIEPGNSTLLTCLASDPDGDTLSYTWSSEYGIISGQGAVVSWQSPANVGYYFIKCQVSDGKGGIDVDSIGISVGSMVIFFPFNGDAQDSSGFENHGIVSGATPTEDRFGNANAAFYFDGIDDNIQVANHSSLNFRKAISINFWMKVAEFFPREAYPISHGNWENRWKISITNNGVRWTIKTDTTANNGIIDLDSQTQLLLDSLYMVTVLFDGSSFEIYLNGILDASSSWGGLILPTTIDLSIAQHLPGNSNYSFKGVLDDIRIYARALTLEEIQELYQGPTGIQDEFNTGNISSGYRLEQNYPNPFNPSTTIRFYLLNSTKVSLKIFDVIGREVETLLEGKMSSGNHEIIWNALNVSSGIYYYRLETEDFVDTKKMLLIK
jgi:hypothetical protein